MSNKESRNTNFGEVIDHIKDAQNRATNKGMFPLLRDGGNLRRALFTSTKQGTADANGHVSIRAMSRHHNKAHGDRKKAFYGDAQMLPGDRFRHEIVP
ncbi:hypothetical protein [Streptosporangium sp. NPDC000509]|uniref:hypothetical protein n=1 Tax=Streptosporangium sp. NPDC000509 TaxID=3366186 RepID=UPI00367E2CB4